MTTDQRVQWERFICGEWTQKVPRVAGQYAFYSPSDGEVRFVHFTPIDPNVGFVENGKGTIMIRGNDRFWFWTAPLPDLPKPKE
jgi:hypothetical protein